MVNENTALNNTNTINDNIDFDNIDFDSIDFDNIDFDNIINDLIKSMINSAFFPLTSTTSYNRTLDKAKKIIKKSSNHTKNISDNVIITTYYESIKTTILKLSLEIKTIQYRTKKSIDEFALHSLKEKFDRLTDAVSAYEESIKNIYLKSESCNPKIKYDPDKANNIINDIICNKVNYDKELNNLQDELKLIKRLADNELKTITNIMREGKASISQLKLATSFEKRGEKLNTNCNWWLSGTILIILIVICLSIYLAKKSPDISTINFDQLNTYIRASIFHVPIFIGLFWSLWFSSKQYSYSCKLRDDYHYKSDLSTAFYGYNEEATKLAGDDKEIRLALLDIVIKNIGKNPIDPNSPEYHSPYAEIIDKCIPVIKKAKSSTKEFVKATNE